MVKTIQKEGRKGLVVVALLVLLTAVAVFQFAASTPYGPTIDSATTEDPGTSTSGTKLNHSKGKITTVKFNVTQPNQDWKGYVGNITGVLVLDDAANYTLYQWDLTTITGEVYATRNSGSITWSNVDCANATHVSTEETAMGISSSEDDSISNTFNNGNHPAFVVGTTSIAQNACNYSQYMYVNDAAQTTDFSEVLLSDGSYIIYTGILENKTQGFDGKRYDFELILAENGDSSTNQAYYFYVELG
ncbi:hypothetical protein DRJ48_03100 [Candidatus Woesearchaeota archaeon]|nr:MAG: hypothetical protein DRJ48_03100 [Candidatus Woesearchaeota archaeon]